MSGSRRGVLIGLLVLITAIAFEAQAVTTAMPAAAEDLGQLELYAWAFTAFVLPQIVAIVEAGRRCDRWGPVRPLKIGIGVFVVGIVISALAPSMPVLLCGRFVQGFGAGVVNLSLMVLVGRVFTPGETGRVMTWFSAAWMLPSLLGPGAAAWLTGTWSWHAVFWAVLPFVAVGVVLLWSGLRGIELPGLHDPDAPTLSGHASLLVALGAALVQAAGQRHDAWALVLGVVGLVLLAVWTPALMPVGWRPAGDGLSAIMAVRALMTGAFFAASAFLPLMLVQLRGLSLLDAGLSITVASLGWTVGSWLQSRPWLGWSRDRIIAAGALAELVGLGVVVAAVALTAPLAVVVSGAAVAGVGMGLAMASTSIAVMQLSPPAQLGRNTGALQVAEGLGNGLLTGAAGTLFIANGARGMTLAFALPFAAAALSAAVALLWASRIGTVPNLSLAGSAESRGSRST